MFSLCLSLLLLLPPLYLWHLCTTVLCLSLQLLLWLHFDGATSNIGLAYCCSASTADAEGHRWCCWPCHCVTAVTLVSDASGISQLCHGFSTCKYIFQSWVSHWFPYICWCLFWCMLSALRCHAWCHIHQSGFNHWGLHCCSPSEHNHDRHMCILVTVIGPCQEYIA